MRSNSSLDEPRREVPPGLPAVEQAEPDEDRQQREKRAECDDVPPRRGEPVARQWPLVLSDFHGSGSISRRTKRHSTPLASQASRTKSSRSLGACGIVTRTVSGRAATTIRRISSALPRTGTPSKRRRHSRGSSSTKPTTCSPGVSRSSRAQASAAASGADDEDAPSRSGSAQRRHAAVRSPLPEARCADEQRAEQRVDHENRARKVSARARGRDHAPGDEL